MSEQKSPEILLASQIIALAWIRCLQEEGLDFVDKRTGVPEKDERVIYEELETKSGVFDVPAAKASRAGLEKNLLEVYGSYCLFNDDEDLLSLLFSSSLKRVLKENVDKLRMEKT